MKKLILLALFLSLVSGLTVWIIIENRNGYFEYDKTTEKEIAHGVSEAIETKSNATIDEAILSQPEESESTKLLPKTNQDYPNNEESTNGVLAENESQEYEFMGDPILIGEVSVLDEYTGLVTEGFGIYFNEEIGVLTQEKEIIVDESPSGDMQKIHIEGVSKILTDTGELEATNTSFTEKDGKLVIDADTVTFDSKAIGTNIQQDASGQRR